MRLRATRLSAIAHAARRVIAGASWSPDTSWFSASEQGLWYDPTDLTRYMGALGPELVTNGDFSSGTTGWAAAAGVPTDLSVSGGRLVAKTLTNGLGRVQQTVATVAGKTYRVSVSAGRDTATVGARFIVFSGSNLFNQSSTSGVSTLTGTFVATSTSVLVFLDADTSTVNTQATFDDVSVRELTAISTATMYQDSAGTTPVTAVEQPVGLILDRRLGLPANPVELISNGTFTTDTSGWTRGLSSVDGTFVASGGVATYTRGAADGGAARMSFGVSGLIVGRQYFLRIRTLTSVGSSDRVVVWTNEAQGFGGSAVFQGAFSNASRSFLVTATHTTMYVSVGFASSAALGDTFVFDDVSLTAVIPGNHATQATSTARPTLRNRYNLLLATATLATQNVTTVATGYQLRFAGAGSITLSGTAAGTYSAGTHSITCTAGTLTLTVSGSVTTADLLTAADAALPYQWVVTATNYDSDATKFPLAGSLDGSDDHWTVAAGGGATTGAVWVVGLRLNALGAARTIWSDAGTNTGYRLRINASNQVEFSAGNGTAYTTATVATAMTLGERVVISARHDGATLSVQVNNGAVATASMGAVTAGTAGITIGKANGAASEYLPAYLYGCIYVRDPAKAATLASANTWMGARMGITV
jgi:hypothetical protein